MIRFTGVVFFIFLSLTGMAQNIDEARNLYLEAVNNREKTQAFNDLFETEITAPSSLIAAYKATAIAMKADIVSGPLKKFKTFSKGKDLLEQSILSEPKNVEVRFLRFAIQSNIPAFLAYDNIDEDKRTLLSNLKVIHQIGHKELRDFIYSTLLKSSEISIHEKSIVTEFLTSKDEELEYLLKN